MKKNILSVVRSAGLCFVVAGLALGSARAQEKAGEATVVEQVPVVEALGTPLLAPDALTTAQLAGAASQKAQRESITVEGPGFTQAVRVRSETLPPGEADVQLVFPVVAPIAQNDVLVARFWMRGQALRAPVAGRPHVGVALEDLNGKLVGEAFRGTVPGLRTWREFRVAIQAKGASEAGQARLALRLGIVPQQVEIGGLTLSNLKKTVSFESLRYFRNRNRGDNDKPQPYTKADQAADAPWRKAAHERIEKHRKAGLQVHVTDAAGKPVTGARVQVTMKRHAFPFSTAVGAEMITGTDSDAERYREILTTWFNGAAPENDLKWHKWNGERTWRSTEWLRARNFHIHGHTLMWGHWGYIQGKERAQADKLKKDSPAMQKLIVDHIRDVVTKFRGRVEEWDVLNEPYTQNTVMGALGDAAMVEWFKTARATDPDARLYINEFNILEDSNHGQVDAFEKTVRYLIAQNTPLDGIGMQSHFGTATSPGRIVAILDRFAKLNKRIAITEFDQRTRNEKEQGLFMRDFLTATFSHPAVDSINIWGIWEKKHWIPEAALFRADWSMKPNGQAWHDLVRKAWWTNAQGATGATGTYTTRGFLGDYEVTITHGGKTKTMPLVLTKQSQPLVVVLS